MSDIESNANLRFYSAVSEAINKMSKEDISELVMTGNCPNPTQFMKGVPIGMHHCPLCGLMVVAGLHHGPYKWIGTWEDGYADFPDEE